MYVFASLHVGLYVVLPRIYKYTKPLQIAQEPKRCLQDEFKNVGNGLDDEDHYIMHIGLHDVH